MAYLELVNTRKGDHGSALYGDTDYGMGEYGGYKIPFKGYIDITNDRSYLDIVNARSN